MQGAISLGQLGENARDALADLTAALKDDDHEVRVQAAEARWRIDGQADKAVAEIAKPLRMRMKRFAWRLSILWAEWAPQQRPPFRKRRNDSRMPILTFRKLLPRQSHW